MIETGKYNPYHASSGQMFAAFRRFFMGKKFPNTYTRIVCNLGIVSFLYYFCWSLVVLLLLDFGTGLPKYKEWNEIFLSYGLKYGIYDIHFMFNTFVVCVLVFSVALLIGIILTWRQKKGGHVIVIISQVLLAASPLLIMGVEYFNAEVLAYEWMSAGVLMLLFLTGYFLKLRKKA